jgi:preprotein translocase subunit YajC
MFESLLIVEPSALVIAFQDALSNSLGGSPAGGGAAGGGGGQNVPPPGGGMMQIFIMMGFLLLVMILMSTMTSRREKKRRAELLASIRKGDRVLTTGGIIGRVVDVSADEVVLKIDENANIRTRFTINAVVQVLKAAEPTGSADSGGASGGGTNGASDKAGTEVEIKAGRARASA